LMRIDLQVVGECVEGSWPVEIFIEQKNESVGPLEPEEVTYKSVGDILKEEGLAICLYLREGFEEVPIGGDGHAKSKLLIEDRNSETDLLSAAIEDEENEDVQTILNDTKKSVSKFQWLEPTLPSSNEFLCFASHVDWKGNLYISSIPENQDKLMVIQGQLQERYAGSVYDLEDLGWSTGDACIAMFDLDKKWYRGMVLKVEKSGKCLVKFVDYGSEEVCEPFNLRRGVLCKEIPIQCFTVKLKVMPITDKWTKPVLDFLHESVVDRELVVSISEEEDMDTFPLSATVFTKSGLDIKKLLVQKGFAKDLCDM